MEPSNETSDVAAKQVRTALAQGTGTRAAVRFAARMAARGARSLGRSAGHLAHDAVEGTVQAVGEIGGETTAFVRDAVIGVIEGTEQVVAVTKPAVKEVVAGAIRGGTNVTGDVGAVTQNAVEGAIVGAASVGIDATEAAVAATEAAVEAVSEAGGDLRDATAASISGVMTGVSATGGDLATAVRDSAATLVDHVVADEPAPEDVATVAIDVLGTVLSEAEKGDADAAEIAEVVSAAAGATVTAAYQISQVHGDVTRHEVVQEVSRQRRRLAPELQRQLSEVGERLSKELPQGKASWRGAAMFRAARLLFRVGVSDRAASLAYFTALSFLPLMALAIIAFSFFTDALTTRTLLEDLVAQYFPASTDLLRDAVNSLIENSTAFGLVALGGLAFSVNGLFMATNRAVNHVFEVVTTRSLRRSIAEAVLNSAIGTVLLLSIGASLLVPTTIGFGGEQLHSPGEETHLVHTLLGALSAVLPAGVTGLVFTVAYHRLPRTQVEWKDAAFGGLCALILFEGGKLLFFWISGMAAQRFSVYGPVASTVVLLTWAYVAGIIFLYGAAITKIAGELRPRRWTKLTQADRGPQND